MPPSPHGARVMQPVGWVLNEAAHPVASQYHRLVGDLDGAPAALSLLRARDCADLLFRYACLIHLAHRYAVLGENSAWEQRVLHSRLNPDTPLQWLDLLAELDEAAQRNGWEETAPIHRWLQASRGGASTLERSRAFCAAQERLLPALRRAGAVSPPAEAGDADMDPLPHVSELNALLEEAAFLKSWPLLHRFQGTTQAWMGPGSPRDTKIRTPRRFEGQFVLHLGGRRFLALSPYVSLLAGPLAEDRLAGVFPAEGFRRLHAWVQSQGLRARQWLDRARVPAQDARDRVVELSGDTAVLLKSLGGLLEILRSREPVGREEFGRALETIVLALKKHRATPALSGWAEALRRRNVLPNEQSTEHLIRFLVDQVRKRSPVPVPDLLVSQFWTFFSELERDPDAKGLMEVHYDILRSLLRIYEPMLVEAINAWKQTRQVHEEHARQLAGMLERVAKDVQIFRRQVLALRHIRAFLRTDPQDVRLQAEIVARMVGEFGPFFIKFAQVAATHTEFLPREIAAELEQFHEKVPAMPAGEMLSALQQSFGLAPQQRYFGLDPAAPIRSGSIASVYLAKKPVVHRDREVLVPVILKVARDDLEREFFIGEKVLELAILSTHYWAPHSKISPFLEAWVDQVRQWSAGFKKELDFRKEASVQQRFNRLACGSRIWSAPRVYASTDRVLEMEYVRDAESVSRLVQARGGLARDPAGKRRRHRVAERLLHTVLLQAVQARKIHGDLHPGNILVDGNGKLHLIDWGNTIDLERKILPLLRYVQGVLLADRDRIARALVAISSDPEGLERRLAEIRDSLGQTLARLGVRPLLASSLRAWRTDPGAEIRRRLEAIPHVLSNTQTLGIAVHSDYLQMSRSLSALLGTYLSLFPAGEKTQGLLLLARSLATFPLVLARESLAHGRHRLGLRLAGGPQFP